ncbi:PepSY domain-containing protein [Allorhodopirellula solitaria]|uniref:Peptidase propeptide and YPEB domain protein n=1 Tax=Allorhodopirellula solitaria TaxID=2527987 RepID=A0A5C5XR67_9BACT|nr:PepSY domain-containing protein [Allorhodopirellula solitaria]TWT65148.1 Peptidase propeptide and YPEB domain protein [Allorhodopirellula solitaria]
MKSLMLYAIASLAALLPVGHVIGQTATRQPKPIVEIVKGLEADGYGPFNEVSMDHQNWEVEAIKDRVSYELTVDAKTGEVLGQHRDDPDTQPPANAMPLSKVLQKIIENTAYDEIDEVSFERRYWEVEVYQDLQQHELHVDPVTARIVSDRLDD